MEILIFIIIYAAFFYGIFKLNSSFKKVFLIMKLVLVLLFCIPTFIFSQNIVVKGRVLNQENSDLDDEIPF